MDERLVTFPLTPLSVVVEVGGYEGAWASEIYHRYQPRLYVYEPQGWAYSECLRKLPPAVQVFNYGLWNEDITRAPMCNFRTDGASFIIHEERNEWGRLREAGHVFHRLGLTHIDLMQVNIEGGEYILLPHLLKLGWLDNIDYLIVQFHLHRQFQLEFANVMDGVNQTHDILWAGTHTVWRRKGLE